MKDVKKILFSNENIENDISKTKNLIWKPGILDPNKLDGKKTTFAELFFDLIIVFIFSLLAIRFMASLGLSTSQIFNKINDNTIETKPSYVGILFWLAHFFALWISWYQFKQYSKLYGKENFRGHAIMLCLIMILIIQGAGIIFENTFLIYYSLFISFLLARILFLFAQRKSILNSQDNSLKKSQWKRWKITFWLTINLVLIFIVYMSLQIIGVINISNNNNILETWVPEIIIAIILLLFFSLYYAVSIWWIIASKESHEYRIIFHTKERYHLFIIVAIGEILVVSMTSSLFNDTLSLSSTDIAYLVVTPLIAFVFWYLYKDIYFKSNFKNTKRNHYLHSFSHIAIILGFMFFLGSLKSAVHAYNADLVLKNGQRMIEKAKIMANKGDIQALKSYWSLTVLPWLNLHGIKDIVGSDPNSLVTMSLDKIIPYVKIINLQHEIDLQLNHVYVLGMLSSLLEIIITYTIVLYVSQFTNSKWSKIMKKAKKTILLMGILIGLILIGFFIPIILNIGANLFLYALISVAMILVIIIPFYIKQVVKAIKLNFVSVVEYDEFVEAIDK